MTLHAANGIGAKGMNGANGTFPEAEGDEAHDVRRRQGHSQGTDAHRERVIRSDRKHESGRVTSATLQTTLPFLGAAGIAGLIFGGCCSNVFALEAIIETTPDAGLLITLTQFVLVAVYGYYRHFSLSNPPLYIRPNAVPLSRWAINILLFFSINVLNNWAFAFRISVPVHIILRSGGSVTTMAVGYMAGKRYSRVQVISVALLTIGVVVSALADAQAKGKSSAGEESLTRFIAGLSILFVAQVLSALMGLYVQETYAKFGTHWEENLFYSHALSLPLFIPMYPSLLRQYRALAETKPLAPPAPIDDLLAKYGARSVGRVPVGLLYLLMNALTQFACIRGVNKLAARASALAVTIVLNIRKLASLLLSIWLFGNTLAPGVLAGAAIVFVSGGLYAWNGGKRSQKKTQ